MEEGKGAHMRDAPREQETAIDCAPHMEEARGAYMRDVLRQHKAALDCV